jgi:hypothetical protein
MAINRQQVEELRSNISIQPTADPVDRTIISKAPNITPDPTMNAWAEMARDFAAGFTALKKAQVEADIPMGEQFYLESGVDGLFEAGKPELGAMSAMVEQYKLAEEHSVGTRIGFERAAGRSAAYRERSKITDALDKFIVESGGLDANGLPKLPTATDVDRIVGEIRAKSYGEFNSRPEYSWFTNSPYAAEEYNKLTRDFVPQITENYKQKARERITEQKRAMVAEQAVDQLVEIFETRGQDPAEAAVALQAFGQWVDENVRLGSIPDPKKFLAETMKSAGLTWMNKNPGANMPAAMNDFNRVIVDGYNYNGANLGGLYGSKAKDDLTDEARRRTGEALAERDLRIRKAIDEDQVNGDKEGSLTFLINTNLQNNQKNGKTDEADRLKAIQDAVKTWRERRANDKEGNPKYSEEVIKGIAAPYLSAIAFDIQVKNSNDDAVQEQVAAILMDPNNDNAAEDARKLVAERVIHPTNRAKLYGVIQKAQDAKLTDNLLKDPVFKVQLGEFKDLQKPIRLFSEKDVEERQTSMGIRLIREKGPITVRGNIKNKAVDEELKSSYNEANFGLMTQIAAVQQDPTKSVSEKRTLTADLIDEATKRQRSLNKGRVDRQAELELRLQEAEENVLDAAGTIIQAFRDGVIDADSRDALLNANRRRFADLGITENNLKLTATELVKNKARDFTQAGGTLAENPFLSRRVERVEMGFTTAEGATATSGSQPATKIVFKPTEAFEAEVATIARELAADLPKFYMNASTRAEMVAKYKIQTPPVREAASALAKQIMERRINELLEARFSKEAGFDDVLKRITTATESRPK